MKLICTICPKGCNMEVLQIEDGEWIVANNGCKRGREYAIQESTCPTRVLTTSIWVDGGEHKLVSVKTNKGIPKHSIKKVLNEIKNLHVVAPISIGDIIIENVGETDAALVATRKIARKT